MARLKVGDIEIDGGHVSIGGQSMARTSSAAPGTPTVSDEELGSWLARIRIPAWALIMVGGALTLAGGIWFALDRSWTFEAYLLHGGLIASTGAGIATLGLLKRTVAAREALAEVRRRGAQIQADGEVIERRLRGFPGHKTIEVIAADTSLPEDRVIRALVALRAAERITEDLDVQTGSWVYSARPLAISDDASKSLDDRLTQMERSKDR